MGEIILDYKKRDKEVKKLKDKYKSDTTLVRKRDYENFVQIKESGKEGKSKLFENYTYRNNKWKCDPITFDDKEYIFCSFIESKFGKSAVLREEDMYHVQVNFWNVTFNNCNFENIYFEASRSVSYTHL